MSFLFSFCKKDKKKIFYAKIKWFSFCDTVVYKDNYCVVRLMLSSLIHGTMYRDNFAFRKISIILRTCWGYLSREFPHLSFSHTMN